MAPQTEHTRAEALFSAYIDQRVTADEKAFVERHVAACADCRAKLNATRAMVAALRTLPVVKAPRSFVLPREMERKPRASLFNWYPALRLATVLAAVAFIVTFAGDLMLARSGSTTMIPMQAAAPAAAPAPMATAAVPETAAKQAAPAAPTAPTAEAPGETARALPTPTDEALMAAGAAATVTDTATLSEPMMALRADMAPTETMTATATSAFAPTTPAAAIEPAAPQPDWLRVATIALGGLVIVLGAATLMARRGT